MAAVAAGFFVFGRKKPRRPRAQRPAGPGPVTGESASSAIKRDSLAVYIQDLYDLAERLLPALKEFWHADRLRAITLDAAKATGVDPAHIWGIMYGESRLRPTGVNGQFKGTADIAIGKRSSAYGMGQILSTRFEKSEKAANSDIWWEHQDLLAPRATIWTIAHSLARQRRTKPGRGGTRGLDRPPTPYEVGFWWSQNDLGAKRKEEQITAHGHKVHEPEGSGPIAPMELGPPVPGTA